MRVRSLALLFLLFASSVPARQDPARQPELVQRAAELAQVTDAHRRLGKLVGSWDVTFRTTPAGSAEQEGRGVVDATSILGGRYVQLAHRFTLGGREVQAMQILGFDNLRQLYTSSWRDELATWSVECSGVPTPGAPDVLRLEGVLADARDPAGRPFRCELDLSAKDSVQVRWFETVNGVESLVQAQQWTRRS